MASSLRQLAALCSVFAQSVEVYTKLSVQRCATCRLTSCTVRGLHTCRQDCGIHSVPLHTHLPCRSATLPTCHSMVAGHKLFRNGSRARPPTQEGGGAGCSGWGPERQKVIRTGFWVHKSHQHQPTHASCRRRKVQAGHVTVSCFLVPVPSPFPTLEKGRKEGS
jgi:hypothetical protein